MKYMNQIRKIPYGKYDKPLLPKYFNIGKAEYTHFRNYMRGVGFKGSREAITTLYNYITEMEVEYTGCECLLYKHSAERIMGAVSITQDLWDLYRNVLRVPHWDTLMYYREALKHLTYTEIPIALNAQDIEKLRLAEETLAATEVEAAMVSRMGVARTRAFLYDPIEKIIQYVHRHLKQEFRGPINRKEVGALVESTVEMSKMPVVLDYYNPDSCIQRGGLDFKPWDIFKSSCGHPYVTDPQDVLDHMYHYRIIDLNDVGHVPNPTRRML
jgi:hypothetical protein